jgi:hypothetical protein
LQPGGHRFEAGILHQRSSADVANARERSATVDGKFRRSGGKIADRERDEGCAPRERSGAKGPRERVGEFEGRNPSTDL